MGTLMNEHQSDQNSLKLNTKFYQDQLGFIREISFSATRITRKTKAETRGVQEKQLLVERKKVTSTISYSLI